MLCRFFFRLAYRTITVYSLQIESGRSARFLFCELCALLDALVSLMILLISLEARTFVLKYIFQNPGHVPM